jgi:enoyl-CoA hydratase
MSYQDIRLERDGGIATITFDRPDSLNSLSIGMSDELEDAIERLKGDRSIDFVVFTGANNTFCSGDDITEMPEWGDPADVMDRISRYQRLSQEIQDLQKVTIAAVDGYATGGGLEITMVCDFVVATERAEWGMPEVNWGITPGWGGTTRLTRYVGLRRAREINMIGAIHPAEEAVEEGLWNKAVPAEDLDTAVASLIEVLESKNMQTLRQLKLVLNYGAETPVPLALGFERMNEGLSASNAWDVGPVSDAEPGEGLEAFRSKNEKYERLRELSDDFWIED